MSSFPGAYEYNRGYAEGHRHALEEAAQKLIEHINLVEKWKALAAMQGDSYNEGVAWGRADALAGAVQRYEEATKADGDCGCELCLAYSERIIAAIKEAQ